MCPIMNVSNHIVTSTPFVYRRVYWTDWGREAVYNSNYDGSDIKEILINQGLDGTLLGALTLDHQGTYQLFDGVAFDKIT